MRRWLVLATTLVVLVASAQTVRYEFESIEVDHAAAFQADPANATHEDWATAIVGEGPINVTFGAVRMHRSDGEVLGEGFLKIEGTNGTWRALVNSGSWKWDENRTHATRIALSFSSHKQVEENAIVKNFTPPVHSVTLIQHLEDGEVVDVQLWADDPRQAGQGHWAESPQGKLWQGRLDTFRQVGQPAPEGA